MDADVVVVGAGPAGLAAAACLKRAGARAIVVDRADAVGSTWRSHYDRLHLHTSRAFSSLPHRPMPRSFPRYPSRDQVVEYFDTYARSEGLELRLRVEVRAIRFDEEGWLIDTDEGVLRSRAVVVATGANGAPRLPHWPGVERFPGDVLHSSEYRNGAAYRGRDVLVVGFGNSGGEIALDLLEHGARPVLSVRSAVNVVPKELVGIPVLAIAIPLSLLPAGVADALIWPILKAYYPSYTRLGLRKAARGPFRQIRDEGRIPLLDIGTTREVRRGRIGVSGDVQRIVGPEVYFVDGSKHAFDAIVCATGFRPRVPPGVPMPSRKRGVQGAHGLYYCGFFISPTGMLREIGIEAREIARRVTRGG